MTSQALLTPVLHKVALLPFLAFFGLHSLVVWAAIYLTWGVGLRPDWRSYRVAVLATMCWGLVMFTFNRLAATNYGFLDAKPQVESMLDLLGTWPWYLLSLIACALAILANTWAVTLPLVILVCATCARGRLSGGDLLRSLPHFASFWCEWSKTILIA